jgi:hypothetical protein
MKTLRCVFFSVALIAVLAGCLTQEQSQTAKNTALKDPRFSTLLANHSYSISSVARHIPVGAHTDMAAVNIKFNSVIPMSEWPLDVCGTLASASYFRGIRWLVDFSSKQIGAVSLVLDDGQSCID